MSKAKILIVEDNAMIRELIGIVVSQSQHYKVVGEVGDGSLVIEKCKEVQPDLVILDVLLPGMNGTEVTRKVRSEYPRVKILGITANQRIHTIKEMLAAGVHGFVLKDDSWKELEKALDSLMAGDQYFSSSVSVLMSQALQAQDNVDSSLTRREK